LLVICNSDRKKKLVCGLISSSAWPSAVCEGRWQSRWSLAVRGSGCLFLLGHGDVAAAVEGFQLAERHALDVAPDAALAEGERHPWLEMRDHARVHLGVIGQIGVQPAAQASISARSQAGLRA
jgi:hypothetical protein